MAPRPDCELPGNSKTKLENRMSKLASGARRARGSARAYKPRFSKLPNVGACPACPPPGAGSWQAAAEKPKFLPPRESLPNRCARM